MLEFIFIQDLYFREITRKVPGKHATHSSVDILEANYQKSKGNVIIEINAPYERWCSPRQIRKLIMRTRLVNLPSGTSTELAHLPHEATM